MSLVATFDDRLTRQNHVLLISKLLEELRRNYKHL